MKTVQKPWGREVWISLTERYCYKILHITKGHRTSLQYHVKKLETNYVISGTGQLLLDDNIHELFADTSFTVRPGQVHRIKADTDLVLHEVSTPEVDDVIRVEDDEHRPNGKIEAEHQRPALCILAAGLGERMDHLTHSVNKGLLPIDNKAIISHMIDKTPNEYEIVIALGYKGDMVREYCEAAHPDRDFIFVDVDKYEGKGSSVAYSMLQCKPHLQRPFIWTTADTIIMEDTLPAPTSHNWMGVYPTSLPEMYSTAKLDGDRVVDFKNKHYDGYEYAFIGLAGIHDHQKFWDQLFVDGGEIVSAFYGIDEYPTSFEARFFDWYDVGTIDNYMKAVKQFGTVDYAIPKTNGEFLYLVGGRFIKLFSESDVARNRIRRAEWLGALVPTLCYTGNYLYAYNWIFGYTVYEGSRATQLKFLDWAQKNLWHPIEFDLLDLNQKFYYSKTNQRKLEFLKCRDDSYTGCHVINGKIIEDIEFLLESIKWEELFSNGIPTHKFHGDLQFDNVIRSDNRWDGEFKLLDWRQDFGGSTEVGDAYYDLAKLYGGLLIPYNTMKDSENFSCNIQENVVTYTHDELLDMTGVVGEYEQWLKANKYSIDRVRLITALIFLNMAPLHEKEFGDMMFFKAKELLQQEVIDDH